MIAYTHMCLRPIHPLMILDIASGVLMGAGSRIGCASPLQFAGHGVSVVIGDTYRRIDVLQNKAVMVNGPAQIEDLE
jgi:hypothetical protein